MGCEISKCEGAQSTLDSIASVEVEVEHAKDDVVVPADSEQIFLEGLTASHSSLPDKQATPSDLRWLNCCLSEIWPYAADAVKKLVKETVEPALREATSVQIYFSKFDVGTNAPRLGPVNVHKHEKQNGLQLDIGVNWDLRTAISLNVMGIELGVSRVDVEGEVSIVLRPLMHTMPIVGGIQLFMISPPKIQWDFTGIGNLAHLPFIAPTVRSAVDGVVAKLMVLPNRLFVHWVWGHEREIDITSMMCPVPEALMRIGVVEAKGLKGMDWNLLRSASSDPYAKLSIGATTYKTPCISRTLEPKWGADGFHDFFVYSPRQLINLSVIDSDIGVDDLIGNLRGVTVGDVLKHRNRWWPIYCPKKTEKGETAEDGEEDCGKVRLVAQAFSLHQDEAMLQTLPKPIGSANAVMLLVLKIECLRGVLPKFATGASVRVNVAGETYTTAASQFLEATQDLIYGMEATPLEQKMQWLVEFMCEEGYSEERIATEADISVEVVRWVAREKPSFTARWHQPFYIPIPGLDDPFSFEVELELLLPGESTPLKAQAPIPLAQLRNGQPWPSAEGAGKPVYIVFERPCADPSDSVDLLESSNALPSAASGAESMFSLGKLKKHLATLTGGSTPRTVSAAAFVPFAVTSNVGDGPFELDCSFQLLGMQPWGPDADLDSPTRSGSYSHAKSSSGITSM
eukprot:NODE_2207_length_2267_cov_11.217757.p1 GENE.NODE_2207_length_2267_cov_11.217757~~NODE_2207_length_2267_cov_11.217757.p1  ORF type:complete len:684 (+),score=134.93 NODE_2207_length_2267_cov_11.217757:202-2253(+)